MGKNYKTIVTIDIIAKGFNEARQKAIDFNKAVAASEIAQAKGFESAQKQSASFGKSLEKLSKVFSGTSNDFRKHIQAIGKEFKALDKMDLKDVRKQIDGLQGDLTDLHKKQAVVLGAMAGLPDKAGSAYKELEDHLKSLNNESRIAEQRVTNLTRAFAGQFKEEEKAARLREQSKGAFVQGLAQGGLPFPAPFLQRGPGMGKQIAGMTIGRALTGGYRGAQALGAGMFGGVGGFAQMMTALPGGAALSGQFMTAAGYAEQNIQWQRQKLEAAPYMENIGDILGHRQYQLAKNAGYRKASERKEKAEAEYNKLMYEQNVLKEKQQAEFDVEMGLGQLLAAKIQGPEALDEELGRRRNRRIGKKLGGITKALKRKAGYANVGPAGFGSPTVVGDPIYEEENRKAYEESVLGKFVPPSGDVTTPIGQANANLSQMGSARLNKSINTLQKQIDTQWARVNLADAQMRKQQVTGRDPFEDIGRMGLRLMGVAKPEATQFGMGLLQTGGGYEAEARQQNMLGISMAAKTLLGAGPEISGAFLQAGRRGGLVGARDRGGEAYKEVIADGFKLGLEGSELTNWLQITAQGIQQFETTGIPVNPRSIVALADDISKSGVTGSRAMTMATGLAGGLQQIGQRGIQSGLDHIMLQLIGGYQGGGAKEYRAARARMETFAQEMQGKGIEGVAKTKISGALRSIMGYVGGDEGTQAEILQRTLEKYGVRGSIKEFDWLARSLRGEKATPEQLKAIQREERKRARGKRTWETIEGGGGLEGAAATTVSGYAPGARTQAGLANQQIAVGGRMTGVVLKLEQMAINTTTAFTKLTGKPMEDAVSGLDALAKKAFQAAEALAGHISSGKTPAY